MADLFHSDENSGAGAETSVDRSTEQNFERITRFAARLCRTTGAIIVLNALDRPVSSSGLTRSEAERVLPLCKQAAAEKSPLIIADANRAADAIELAESGMRFFAALPLVSASCAACGVLAVLDRRARTLKEAQLEGLQVLADQIAVQLELRSQSKALERMTQARDELAAERIQRSEALLEIAGVIARFGGWSIDLPDYRLNWSAQIHGILEFPPSQPPTLEQVLSLYPAHPRRVITEALEQCRVHGAPFDHEVQIHTARGKLLEIRVIGRAVRNQSGDIVRIEGALQDITEFKQRDQQVHQLANSLAATLENISDAFFTLDRDWRFTYVNKEAESILRRSRQELLGRVVWDEFKEAVDSVFYREYHRAIRENCTADFEEYYPPLQRWIGVRAYPSADGLAVYFRDISEQRQLRSAVLKVAAGVSAATGTNFFEQLARNMAEALSADASFVARFLPEAPLTARTITAIVDGKVVENFDYLIEGTPCERFVQDELCVVPDDVTALFPRSPSLAALGARSYVGRRLDNSAGEPLGLLFVLYRQPLDSSDLVQSTMQIFAARAAAELERQEADVRIRGQASLLDKAQDAIIVRGIDHRILFWNKGAERLYGWKAEEALTRVKPELVYHDPAVFKAATEEVLRHGEWRGEMTQRRKDGSTLTVEAHWTLVQDDEGRPQSILSINTDITQRKAAEEEIQRLAFYDQLTKLPNRLFLLQRLEHAIATSGRGRHTGALMFIDLDNFKTLNDTLGHDKGDLLLRQVARRLSAAVRESDTVARLGGDEFVVLLEELSETPAEAALQAQHAGEKILATLNLPYQLAGYEHMSTPSIGITLFQGDRDNVDDVLKRADIAMYEAKGAGRNGLRFFDPEMQAVVTERVALEADLRQGSRDKEFLLHYQPQAGGDGRLTGVEALLRWQHPRRGLVGPGDFINVAEETGLIQPLGQWVLETACRQLVAWSAQPETAQLTIAVNISARQFHHPEFLQQVLTVLDETGANPKNLKLELTESLLLSDVEDTIEKMAVLKAKGVGFSLDDFGTGYSSLSYLKRLPLDQLKIDQSFVKDVLTDPSDAAIARTIVALGQTLGLAVIAEGVETEAQREFLAEHGCQSYQGYLLSQPLPAEQFEQFLQRESTGLMM